MEDNKVKLKDWTIPQLVYALSTSVMIRIPDRYKTVDIIGQDCTLTPGEALKELNKRQMDQRPVFFELEEAKKEIDCDIVVREGILETEKYGLVAVTNLVPEIGLQTGLIEVEQMMEIMDLEGDVNRTNLEKEYSQNQLLQIFQDKVEAKTYLERIEAFSRSLGGKPRGGVFRPYDVWRMRWNIYGYSLEEYIPRGFICDMMPGTEMHCRRVTDMVRLSRLFDRQSFYVKRFSQWFTIRDARALNMNGITIMVRDCGSLEKMRELQQIVPGLYRSECSRDAIEMLVRDRQRPTVTEWMLELSEDDIPGIFVEMMDDSHQRIQFIMVYLTDALRPYEEYLYESSRMSEGLLILVNRRTRREVGYFQNLMTIIAKKMWLERWSRILRQPLIDFAQDRKEILFSKPIEEYYSQTHFVDSAGALNRIRNGREFCREHC